MQDVTFHSQPLCRVPWPGRDARVHDVTFDSEALTSPKGSSSELKLSSRTANCAHEPWQSCSNVPGYMVIGVLEWRTCGRGGLLGGGSLGSSGGVRQPS